MTPNMSKINNHAYWFLLRCSPVRSISDASLPGQSHTYTPNTRPNLYKEENDNKIFSGLQKKLDFTLKVVGGDMTAIPGISDAIEVWEKFYHLIWLLI